MRYSGPAALTHNSLISTTNSVTDNSGPLAKPPIEIYSMVTSPSVSPTSSVSYTLMDQSGQSMNRDSATSGTRPGPRSVTNLIHRTGSVCSRDNSIHNNYAIGGCGSLNLNGNRSRGAVLGCGADDTERNCCLD